MLRICSSSLLSARILIFILFATIALQVNGQIPEDNDEAEPKAVARQQGGKRKAKDDRVILRDLITEIPISPIRVPMGFPQKAAAVLDEVDYNTYEVKRTSVCYIAYEDVSELGNILVCTPPSQKFPYTLLWGSVGKLISKSCAFLLWFSYVYFRFLICILARYHLCLSSAVVLHNIFTLMASKLIIWPTLRFNNYRSNI